MAIDIKLLLAGHPLLFLGREGGVKGFDRGGILAAIRSGAGDVHPIPAIQRCKRQEKSRPVLEKN